MTAALILLMAITTSFSGCARLAEAMGRALSCPPSSGAQPAGRCMPPAAIVARRRAGDRVPGRRRAVPAGEEVLTLASLYSFGILIAFMLASASVVWLRIAGPDMPRPFTMQGNMRIRGG